MKIIDLHKHPFINFFLNLLGFGTLYLPLLIFFDEVSSWFLGLVEPKSMLGKWLAYEAGVMLAWAIIISGLFTLLYLAGLFQDAINSRKKPDNEKD